MSRSTTSLEPIPDAGIAFDLRNIVKVFPGGGGIAVDRLTIGAGRVVAVMGLSGTGKSTLLGMLGGIVPVDPPPGGEPSRLEVRFRRGAGVVAHDLAGAGRNRRFDEFGFVFQNAHLLRNATGLQNIAVAFRASGQQIPLATMVDQAGAVELKPELLAKRARQLSGGEKQRTAIGRGIGRNPQILLADEPTANLDPQNGLRIMGTICRWQRAEPDHRTVIWVTHNILEASIFADEIVLLEPGSTPEAPGHLMAWRSTWPTTADSGNRSDGQTWPMANPRDPRRLASMLFAVPNFPDLSVATTAALSEVASIFINRTGPLNDVQKAAVASVLAHSATTLAATAAETAKLVVSDADRSTTPDAPLATPKRSYSGTVGAGTLSGIGLAELFSHSRIDKSEIPSEVARWLGSPSDLQRGGAAKTSAPTTIFGTLIKRLPLALGVLGVLLLALTAYAPKDVHWLVPCVAVGGVAVALVQPLFRLVKGTLWSIGAFSNSFQVVLFVAIAVFLYAVVLAQQIVNGSFDSSLRSLELSHTVVSYRARNSTLDQQLVDTHDRQLKARVGPELAKLDASIWRDYVRDPVVSFTVATTTSTRWVLNRLWPWLIDAPPANANVAKRTDLQEAPLAFGRWVQLQQSVRWPVRETFKTPDDFDRETACSVPEDQPEPPTFANAAVVSTSSREPVLRQMRYRVGTSIATLRTLPQPPPIDLRPDGDEITGVIVTDRLLDQLRALNGKPADAPLGKYLCIHGPRWHLVRIAGIVENLPKEDLVPALHVLQPYSLYEAAGNERPNATGRALSYDSEAIHFADPRLIGMYKDFFDTLPGQGTILPDAFQRIQKGLQTSRTITDLVGYMVYGVVAFAGLLVCLLTSFFIGQNEKSLCVMRAFGVRLYHIVGLVSLQMLIVWAIALGVTILLGAAALPLGLSLLIGPTQMELISPSAVLDAWVQAIVAMTAAVVIAAAVASTTWWRSTPSVGDRLKELD